MQVYDALVVVVVNISFQIKKDTLMIGHSISRNCDKNPCIHDVVCPNRYAGATNN